MPVSGAPPIRDPRPDRFPNATEAVRELLLAGDDSAAAVRVMGLYRGALVAYVLGSSFRRRFPADEDAESLVNGFFADQVGRPGFLRSWLGRGSRFRYWLLVAFVNHLRHQLRRERAEQRRRDVLVERGRDQRERLPRDVVRDHFDAELARGVAREVLRLAHQSCIEQGRCDDWQTFREHALDGRTYGEIAERDGLTHRQVANRVRYAGSRVQSAVRQVAVLTGTPESELPGELERWSEALTRCRV